MEKLDLTFMDLGKMMHDIFRLFKKRFEEQQHSTIKISTEQFGLLRAISIKDEEVIQKDMADMMGKDKSAILRLIDSLEEKELVRRVVDPKDRRKNYIMVTKTGDKVIEQYMKIVYEILEELKEGLNKSDLETFHKVITHIKNKAEQI